MADHLESLANRFFATVGMVEPAGYRAAEVLLNESVQPYFGGHDYLLLAFSPEVARERPSAELLTYGSPLLDTMAGVATGQGKTAHFYLGCLQPTTGRTLQKVLGQARLPGHLLETGEEQILFFHHALFLFRVSFIGEEREELFRGVAVDLHTGWATSRLGEQTLQPYRSTEPQAGRELKLRLGLGQARQAAMGKLQVEMADRVKALQERLKATCHAEQRQISEHYQAMIDRLEAGKARKGADPERIDAKIRATLADEERRQEDLEKRYRLNLEAAVTQLALVSYPKAVVSLRLQQGKEVRRAVAVWDSLTREGYFALLP
ncbi:MAG: hypothetical protein HY671_09060 [Chloroflexi bacterium]|nr:hypothetical protein [Chloroflexota bacterium]